MLCPSTFAPRKHGAFRIVVICDQPLAAAPTPLPPLRELRMSGKWEQERISAYSLGESRDYSPRLAVPCVVQGNAGGCRNYASWRENEQYALTLSKRARVSVKIPPRSCRDLAEICAWMWPFYSRSL